MQPAPLMGKSGGGNTTTIHQDTDININGVTDPHTAGKAAAGEQGRVNGDLARNARGPQ
jgi:hypothetical protein